MIDLERLHNITQELQRYAELEDTELGEACTALIHASRFTDYVGEEFAQALVTELEEQLRVFKQETRIVEREEMIKRTVVYLEWE